MLSQRRWKRKDESMHRYVLSMQALAKRANVSEMEFIDFIIDGIGNVPNMQILLTARTLDELKTIIGRYQHKYFVVNTLNTNTKQVTTTTNMRQQSATNVKQPAGTSKPRTNIQQATLCYNCSRYGHTKPSCPYPLRPDGSCFRCWRMGHDHRNCPNPAKVLKPREDVAFVADEAAYNEDVIDEFNFSG
ncbi:PREDICTED: uncharacterized protein LOC108358526 [Rhagoletis zephyria]|uniref:uncharacterized protein LOC108358526 n=1 Tax=Rhagoletis zephyria TaxID=28612 RepID=UPI000811A573|nr:PREDICTED: uncharacterized protein LOC108358526 [Rhagoletis zephyria]